MSGRKTKERTHVVAPDPVHQSYNIKFGWPLIVGGDEDEFLGCSLVNLSDRSVRATYKLSLFDDLSNEIAAWIEPEETVVFSPQREGNNEWGTNEFVLRDTLDSCSCKIFRVSIDIYVFDRDDLSSHESLVADIEKTNDKQDLIRLANEDLHQVINQLPQRRNLKAQALQEDNIVHLRGHK